MKSKILLALLLCAGICYGQEEELPTIIADRPGYTWGTEVLQHHKVAWENGFQFEKSTDGAKTLSLSSSVLRYGIFKGTEIYLGTGAQVTDEGQVGISMPSASPRCSLEPKSNATKVRGTFLLSVCWLNSGRLTSVRKICCRLKSHLVFTCCLNSPFLKVSAFATMQDWNGTANRPHHRPS